MSSTTDQKVIEIIIKGTSANATMREMQSAARVMNAELQKLTPNTKEWTDKLQQIAKHEGKISHIASEVKEAKDAFRDAKPEVSSFGDILKGTLAGELIEKGMEKIKDFAVESFKDFMALETQTRKLSFALTNVGHEGSGAFEELKKQSEELEGIFSHKDILGSQAMQAEFGLTSAQIKKLTPQILDLARVQGVDLATATSTALRAIEGQAKGLKTVGITMKDTGSKTENFNVLTEKLTKFQGAAADALNTTAGQADALGNRWEGLKEKVGSFFSMMAQGAVDAWDVVTSKEKAMKVALRENSDVKEAVLESFEKGSLKERLTILKNTNAYILGMKQKKDATEMESIMYLRAVRARGHMLEILSQEEAQQAKDHDDRTAAGIASDEAANAKREAAAEKAKAKREKDDEKKQKFLRDMKDENEKEANDSVDVMAKADAKIRGINEATDKENEKRADKQIAENKKTADQETKDKEAALKKEEEIEKQHAERVKKIMGGLKEFEQLMISGIDSYQTIQHNKEDARIKALDSSQKKENDKDKELLRAKLITQEEYDRRTITNQKKRDAQELQIKKRAFERDQKIAIFKTLIDGAEGSAKIWATYADVPYVAALLQVAEAAAIAMQIAAIKSAPKPYAAGGFNKTSNDPQGYTTGPTLYSNSASGKPFIAGEKGKEWIAPNWMIESPATANIIGQLENIRQTKTFAAGGATGPMTKPRYSSNSTGNDSGLAMVISRLNGILDGGIAAKLYYDDFMRGLDKINGAKNDSKIG